MVVLEVLLDMKLLMDSTIKVCLVKEALFKSNFFIKIYEIGRKYDKNGVFYDDGEAGLWTNE